MIGVPCVSKCRANERALEGASEPDVMFSILATNYKKRSQIRSQKLVKHKANDKPHRDVPKRAEDQWHRSIPLSQSVSMNVLFDQQEKSDKRCKHQG
jgi:hypothetical protein